MTAWSAYHHFRPSTFQPRDIHLCRSVFSAFLLVLQCYIRGWWNLYVISPRFKYQLINKVLRDDSSSNSPVLSNTSVSRIDIARYLFAAFTHTATKALQSVSQGVFISYSPAAGLYKGMCGPCTGHSRHCHSYSFSIAVAIFFSFVNLTP